MLLAGRVLCSMEWPDTQDGRYYWQHGFWVDRSDFSSDVVMGLAILNDMKLLYTNQVQLHGITWYLPGTDDVYFRQTYTFPQFGSLSASESPNLLICARWRMFGEDGSYSYHLHRQPIGEGYLESGEWSSDGFTQSSTRLNTYVAQGIYRTQTGSLIDVAYVSGSPVMWQLRHGTKRRNYRGWL